MGNKWAHCEAFSHSFSYNTYVQYVNTYVQYVNTYMPMHVHI